MTMINLFYFIDNQDLAALLKRQKNFRKIHLNLSKLFSKSVVVNITKIIGEKVKNNSFKKILSKDNIEYFCPLNFKELNNRISKKAKNYGQFKANFNLKYFKILRMLKKSRIRLIQVNPRSFIFENKAFGMNALLLFLKMQV